MPYDLKVCDGVPLYIGGNTDSELDLWFLPAFGESHLCFRDALRQPIGDRARIILFDPPGFGAAPPRPSGLTITELSSLMGQLLTKVSVDREVALVAHSMASIAATRVAAELAAQLRLLVSVEGNLTQADAYLTGLADSYATAQEFHAFLCAEVLARAREGTLPMRYHASLSFADANTLWVLGRSVLEVESPGEEYRNLRQRAVYYWDAGSVPEETRRFLVTSGLRQRRLDGCGHWPMITCRDGFYAQLLKDLQALA